MTNIDLGDTFHEHGDRVPLPTDGTGDAGDFVTFDANGQVTPVSAADDDIVGVLGQSGADASAGDKVQVHVQGVVNANVDSAVSAGEWLEYDGANAGRVAANGQGSTHQVDEGGTAIYRLALEQPRALEDADSDNEALVKLP